MSKLLIIVLLSFGAAVQAKAQDSTAVRTWYEMSGSEFIVSYGDVSSQGQKLDNKARWSGFLHFNHQLHYDYTRAFGLYSGLSLVNVGFANEIPLANGDNMLLKQRSYSLGVPLAFKLGNMSKRQYLALGVQPEYFFHYKQKALYKDEKTRESEWFSNKVRPFNTSLFAELHTSKGFYVRFKYYMNDFLNDKETFITVPGSSDVVSFQPSKSGLYYVSFGWTLKVRKKRPAKKSEV